MFKSLIFVYLLLLRILCGRIPIGNWKWNLSVLLRIYTCIHFLCSTNFFSHLFYAVFFSFSFHFIFHWIGSCASRSLLLFGATTYTYIHTVSNAVKITDFSVPSSYVIEDEENPDPLVLDCAYESEPKEAGIVIKWYLNGTLIYQFIPGQEPSVHAFVSIPIASESRFNLNFFSSSAFCFTRFQLHSCVCEWQCLERVSIYSHSSELHCVRLSHTNIPTCTLHCCEDIPSHIAIYHFFFH